MTKFTKQQIEELRVIMEDEFQKSFVTEDAEAAARNLYELFDLLSRSSFRPEE